MGSFPATLGPGRPVDRKPETQAARELGSEGARHSQEAREPGSQQSREPGTDNADSSESSDNLESLGPIEILRTFKSLNL